MMNQKFATAIQQKTIRKVFNQRSDFIIIGLTGSIESGLSDVTEILSSDYCELERFVSRFQDDVIFRSWNGKMSFDMQGITGNSSMLLKLEMLL